MVPGLVPILPLSPSISTLLLICTPFPLILSLILSLYCWPPSPSSDYFILKKELQTQITNLKDVLGLQKELQDLSLETQSLQRALMGNLQGPISKNPQTGRKGPSQKQGNKKIGFSCPLELKPVRLLQVMRTPPPHWLLQKRSGGTRE